MNGVNCKKEDNHWPQTLWQLLLAVPLTVTLTACEFTGGGIFDPGGLFAVAADNGTGTTTGTTTGTGTSTGTGSTSTGSTSTGSTSTGSTSTGTTSTGSVSTSSSGTSSITGTVSGTIIIAVDANDKVIDVYDTSGRARDVDRDGDGRAESFSIRLQGIPVGEAVRVFIYTDLELVPIWFTNGGSRSNQLVLNDVGSIDLGLLPKPTSAGERVFSEISPVVSGVASLTSTSTVVPAGVNIPETDGLSLQQLNQRGLWALKDGWILGARTYFAAADVLSADTVSNAADTARFFHAVSRVVALGFDTLSDGDASDRQRLGDLLDLFGYAADDSRANLATLKPPARLPDSAPRGRELQSFASEVVAGELSAAIAGLDRVSAQFLAHVEFPRMRDTLAQGMEVDYSDVLVFRALFKFAQSLVKLQQAYDLDVDFGDVAGVDGITIESVLEQVPGFLSLKPTSAADRAAARDYFIAALADLETALQVMRIEAAAGDDQTDELFGYVQQTLDIPAVFSLDSVPTPLDLVTRLRTSLDGPTQVFSYTPAEGGPVETLLLDIGAVFLGVDLRSPTPGLLPAFDGNHPVGSLPDPSLQGVIGTQGFNLNRDRDGNGTADILERVLFESP